MEETEVLMQCGYCKNKSKLIVRAKYKQDVQDQYEEHYVTTWRILECLACSRLNLGEHYIETFAYSSHDDEGEKIVYPVSSKEKHISPLPQSIEKAYNSALKVRDEPSAFAVLIGRTLEMVCKHESATGKVLADRLKNLANIGRIPPTLALMAYQLKELRNMGAHADDDEVQKSDVPIIKEFVDAILEYLYVAPAKVSKLQDRLDGKVDDNYFVDDDLLFL
jgi:Domain of unknown function (DUF4145)